MKLPAMYTNRLLVEDRRGANRRRAGFTLIELLIVVVVIGILASTAIPKFATVKEKAYRSQALADLTGLRTAEESFFVDSNRYASLTSVGWAVRAYARGYSECLPRGSYAQITLAMGTSNYGREAPIIHPPVETHRFSVGKPGDAVLVVSELVRHKRVHVALEAARRARVPIRVVGSGPDHRALIEATGLQELITYRADGFTGDVNCYSVLRLNED